MIASSFSRGVLLFLVCLVAPITAYNPTSGSDLEYRSTLDEWEARDLYEDYWSLDARDYDDEWDLSARDVDAHYAADVLRRYIGSDEATLAPRSFKGALKDLLAQTKPYQCPYPDCDKSYRNKEKAWDHWLTHRVAPKNIDKIVNGPKGEAYIRLLD